MYWLELVEENIIYITIGLACMLIILFIINIILISKQRKLTKDIKNSCRDQMVKAWKK